MLSYKSKNIVMFLVVALIAVGLDLAFGTFIFSSGAASMAITPFISLEKTNECNMAGISSIAYVIDINDIESWPTLAAPTTPGALMRYVGDFTLKSNKYWHTLYSTKEQGELTGEIDGATDGKFFRQKATIFYPRTSADALGMAALFKNADCVVIVKEFSGNGQMRVIGSADIPASIWGSENSGKAYSDQKGITFAVESAGCKPAMIYAGKVETETTVVYAPVRLAVDATSVDVSLGKRFVVGANTAAKTITAFNNMEIGDVVRVEFDGSSDNSAAFTGAFSATALIDAAGEWFEVTKTDTNTYVISGGSFA